MSSKEICFRLEMIKVEFHSTQTNIKVILIVKESQIPTRLQHFIFYSRDSRPFNLLHACQLLMSLSMMTMVRMIRITRKVIMMARMMVMIRAMIVARIT